jgi:tripartite-type tricarboxylate transporter receptor subunit TctC
VLFDNLPSSIEFIRSGRTRALAVTTSARNPALPDVPTVAETVPGYEASAWFGVGAPKGTPAGIIEKINKSVNEALADPRVVAKLAELGGVPLTGTPEEFGKVMAAETEKWSKAVRFAGISID